MRKFKVSIDDSTRRLDVFLHEQLPEFSRSFIEKLIEQGKIVVNSKTQKPSYKLRVGDQATVNFDTKELSKIPKIKLPIIYEDDDCIVIDKPIAVLTHSKGAFNPEATVATFIEPKINGMDDERAGIVHRLDRATSGVIICAKTPEALKWLQKQFSKRKTKKTYLAVVAGELDPKEAIIDMPIARNAKVPKTFHVNGNGKPAVTQYKVLEEKNGKSLLELMPQTGRTHQLRVHLSHLGHPIIGDIFYDGEKYPRLMLHAHKLELTLPNRERREFVAKIPQEFHNIMND